MDKSSFSAPPHNYPPPQQAPLAPPPARPTRPYRGGGFLGAIAGWFSGLFRFLLAATLFSVLVGLVAYWVAFKYIGSEELPAPNLLGKNFIEAAKYLKNDELMRKYNLSLQWEREQPHNTVAKGEIITQSPAPGRRIKAGTPIRVVTSLGLALVEVPDLRGIPRQQAGVLLHNKNLAIGNITAFPEPGSPPGVVKETDPPRGTGVPPGAQINLFVTTGKTQVTQIMPNLKGMSVAQAQDELAKLGTFIGEERKAHVEGGTPGQIHQQTPEAGATISETTNIIVTYEPLAETQPVPTVTPEPEQAEPTPAPETHEPPQPNQPAQNHEVRPEDFNGNLRPAAPPAGEPGNGGTEPAPPTENGEATAPEGGSDQAAPPQENAPSAPPVPEIDFSTTQGSDVSHAPDEQSGGGGETEQAQEFPSGEGQ